MKNTLIISGQIALAVLLLIGCNTSQIDEAVDQNDNPEVADLVNNEDLKEAGASDGRLEVSEEAAAGIAQIEGVEDARVFVSNHNAFVAIDLEDSTTEEVPEEVKSNVTSEIKSSGLEGIDHVYISADPDFRDRLAQFGERVKDGEPVEGLVNEFNGTVERVFPDVTFTN
ncbi:YhcN/YlaJ family sporulation lipoprotein [Jeotgalibacillus sp. ET6]|uniref:YhcN/YlaJ family sporulation lipoprotein n=1 Tax=Jeotgalibacillus sp. ET6 TaxID=3037260 RepID=UPI002418986A|nr:YhcN/YlaJ family sporulation lipoprotein [Jeotgalibacillus sp. ET6]MDG5473240.1 YhcN/YlaJ family sporulation lipoprotein [Jeotgalibacillus sp. ET6]